MRPHCALRFAVVSKLHSNNNNTNCRYFHTALYFVTHFRVKKNLKKHFVTLMLFYAFLCPAC